MTVWISCTGCDTSFQIPEALYESRFSGRMTRLRCRKCGGVIQVDGTPVDEAPMEVTSQDGALVDLIEGQVAVEVPEVAEQTPPVALARELAPVPPRELERRRDDAASPRHVSDSRALAPLRGAPRRAALALALLALASVVPTEEFEQLRQQVEHRLQGANAGAARSAAPLDVAPATVAPVRAPVTPRAPEVVRDSEPPLTPALAATPEPVAEVRHDQKALERVFRWGLARADECHRGGRVGGTARLIVRFGPSGLVQEARVEGEPIASAPVSRCIVAHLRSMRIPAFDGPAFEAAREITLR